MPEGQSKLVRIQRELLTLEKENFNGNRDNSISIHSFSSRLREIQQLYQFLLHIGTTASIEPRDIIVMAPSITPYIPIIEAVFKKIEYQISDAQLTEEDDLTRGIISLIQIEKNRWSSQAILDLFSNPLFRQKKNWEESQIKLLHSWVHKVGIRWGLDEDQQKIFLKKRGLTPENYQESGAWITGLGALLDLLTCLVDDAIEFSQADFLG